MKPKVYVETTVLSYLTARPSRDVIIAGHQQVTHEWWRVCGASFDLVRSQLVIREASAGNPVAAAERRAALAALPVLEVTAEALALAEELIAGEALPRQAAEDALHITIAVANGIDYLVTWNYRHLANATMRAKIEEVCRSAGYAPAIICTPEELLEP